MAELVSALSSYGIPSFSNVVLLIMITAFLITFAEYQAHALMEPAVLQHLYLCLLHLMSVILPVSYQDAPVLLCHLHSTNNPDFMLQKTLDDIILF